MEDMVHSIIDRVEVAEPPFHLVVPHLALQHPKLRVHHLPPESFTGPADIPVSTVVVPRVADTLQTFGNVDAWKSHKRDDTTHCLEFLVHNREDAHDESHHLCLDHHSIVFGLLFVHVVAHELVVFVSTIDCTCVWG